MNTKILSTTLAVAAATLVLAPAVQSAAAATDRAERGETVATVRAATARYHDVAVALADGYLPSDECVASPAGAMGHHYVNPGLAAQPADVRRPTALLYVPSDDGPQLVGVEWIQADADQDPASDGDRPTLLGQPFDGPMPGHGPGQPVHYDLHAWVWQHNPAGMFAPFNPAASC